MRDMRAGYSSFKKQPFWTIFQSLFFPISCFSWIIFLCIQRDYDYKKIGKLLVCSIAGVIGLLLVSGFFGQNFDERMSAILMGNFFYWPAAVWHIYLAHDLAKKYPN